MTRLCPALFLTLSLLVTIPNGFGQTAIENCLVPVVYPDSVASYIPDGDGTCFFDSIIVSGTEEGLLWESLSAQHQVLSINLVHENSIDLTITFTCPNGQSVSMTGGWGPLGEPGLWGSEELGSGLSYNWADDASASWVDFNYMEPIPSGTYLPFPVPMMNQLSGCPIQGQWTLEVCDNLSLFDGHVFSWGVPGAPMQQCMSSISMASQLSSSYCADNGSISITVDPLPEETLQYQLTQNNDEIQWGTLQTNQNIGGLAEGNYTFSVLSTTEVLSEFDIEVGTLIHPGYNAGADPICAASLDAELGWNRVIWQKEDASYIASFDVYRESNVTSEFEWIGNVHVDSLSTFVDVGFDPGASSTRYDLVAVDSCGGEIDFAGAHRTIHLQSNLGVNGEVNLFWNPYEGFNYDNFSIHRSTDGETYFPIGTVANNVYAFTDQFPPASNKWYQIRIPLDNACEPVRSRSSGFIGSNINTLSISGIEDLGHDRIQLTFEAGQWQIMWTGLEGGAVELMDMMGRQVWKGELPGSEGTLPFPSLASGAYLVHVTSAGLLEATRRITY